MHHKITLLILGLVALIVFVSCTTSTTPTPQPPNGAQLPNPASQNCEEQGGQVTFAQDPNGGTYGVCVFPDGKQCEEWAMFRGECPVGGVDVTGYATEAARFCAITGGAYAATANQGTAAESGTCTFKNGKTCDAAAYYAGTCKAE